MKSLLFLLLISVGIQAQEVQLFGKLPVEGVAPGNGSIFKKNKVPKTGKIYRKISLPAILPEGLEKIVFSELNARHLKRLHRLPKEKLILFTWGSPSEEPELYDKRVQAHFSKIYTWDDERVDNQRVFKFFYPVLEPMVNGPAFGEKQLCALMHEAADGERLKEYRFCICTEDVLDRKGYITDKIFRCFAAGVVPVYRGASNVEEYIPKECFIDRRQFPTYERLYRFLREMKEEEYGLYIQNIKRFLESPEAQRFSKTSFQKTFNNALKDS